ncbi:MAG: prepilin-type N-terminal cleavage/methylation domain-containing protein [Synergistaceae bacterium]|nr:prepilin-type N-terminal cleavage/methylation domain-containing protein [Synergistaceae bacterium]MBR1419378.1 prepilin-type N-terminal cleavage/methylation domain-containing protein [Synergistaceae bacterium]MBR1603788.1 prepilin-type N-terminal cleavage/methylation domain-containing protein [Synergistaceae bacterium]
MIVRRGFSLVELMVVIVIMGILGAGVMLSSSSAVASARALTIINDLRSLKEAALLFYLDNPDTAPSLDGLKTYIENPDKITASRYEVTQNTNTNIYFIGYDLTNEPNKAEVKTRLGSRAKSTGLLGDTGDSPAAYAGDGDKVYVKAY